MKSREYEYIQTIANELNITRASERLFVSQPALSRFLKNVENDLGTLLFERIGKRMVLTPAGKVYVERAREIINLDIQMRNTIQEMDKQTDVLSICYPMIRSLLLAKSTLPVFHASYQNVQIMLTIASQRMMQDLLQNGKSQLALGIVTPEYEKIFSYEKIALEEMVLVVPKGYSLREKAEVRYDCNYPFIAADFLRQEYFLLPSAILYSGQFAEHYFSDHAIIPNVAMRLNLTGDLYQHVVAGNGIAILPSIPLQSMGLKDKVEYLSLRDRTHAHTVALLYNKNHVLSQTERALLEIIRRVYCQDFEQS